MRHKTVIGLFFIGLCLPSAGSGTEDEPKRVMNFIAVLDITCGEGVKKTLATPLTNIIIDELVKTGKYTVIDQANRDKILAEQGFQQSGCASDQCVVEMGRLLGVGKIVVGNIDLLGNTYLVNLQIINVQTGAVETSVNEECKCDVDGLIGAVRNAARKLMGQAAKPQPQPVTPTGETPPKPEDIKFIPATLEQQKLCPEDMVYVPAGWFMMGCNSTKDSQCAEDEREQPYHAVYLDAFCIDKYEYPNKVGAKPKARIYWNYAQGMCSSQGKKLPTEAQWEKAARGTDGRVYPWGDSMDDEKRKALKRKYAAGARAWNISPYGAYDMSSNLYEWVFDWYDGNYYKSSPARNPKGSTSGQLRSIRSGSWGENPNDLRTSVRGRGFPDSRTNTVGFRCAKDAE